MHTTTNTPNLAFRPVHIIVYCHRHPERHRVQCLGRAHGQRQLFLSNHPQWRQSGLQMSSLGFPGSPRSKRACSAVRALLCRQRICNCVLHALDTLPNEPALACVNANLQLFYLMSLNLLMLDNSYTFVREGRVLTSFFVHQPALLK